MICLYVIQEVPIISLYIAVRLVTLLLWFWKQGIRNKYRALFYNYFKQTACFWTLLHLDKS